MGLGWVDYPVKGVKLPCDMTSQESHLISVGIN